MLHINNLMAQVADLRQRGFATLCAAKSKRNPQIKNSHQKIFNAQRKNSFVNSQKYAKMEIP